MDTLDWVLILVACIGLNAETNRVRTAAGVSAGQALQG
jgi:hypothetical protein